MSEIKYYVRSRGRISGPFDLFIVHKMLRRGALSRLDQISNDKTTWHSVSDADFGSFARKPGLVTEGSPAVRDGSISPQYFYVQNGLRVGPIPAALLVRLAEMKKLDPGDLVWAVGAEERVRADSISWLPFSNASPSGVASIDRASLRFRFLYLCIVGAALCGLMIWIAAGLQSSQEGSPQASPLPADVPSTQPSTMSVKPTGEASARFLRALVTPSGEQPAPAQVVQSALDETAMSAAVGFVVVGLEVRLSGTDPRQVGLYTGSCFVVNSAGFVITNKHVIEPLFTRMSNDEFRRTLRDRIGRESEPRVWVFFGAKDFPADVVFLSDRYDLAILKVGRVNPFAFRLAQTGEGHRGDQVYAAGFPGIAAQPLSQDEIMRSNWFESNEPTTIQSQFKQRDFVFSLTTGVLSRAVTEEGGQRWLQHEAVVRHGNSGGPLLTKEGVVLGINTLVQRSEEDVQTNMSLDVSQLRSEIDAHARGIVWVTP